MFLEKMINYFKYHRGDSDVLKEIFKSSKSESEWTISKENAIRICTNIFMTPGEKKSLETENKNRIRIKVKGKGNYNISDIVADKSLFTRLGIARYINNINNNNLLKFNVFEQHYHALEQKFKLLALPSSSSSLSLTSTSPTPTQNPNLHHERKTKTRLSFLPMKNIPINDPSLKPNNELYLAQSALVTSSSSKRKSIEIQASTKNKNKHIKFDTEFIEVK